MKWYSVKKYKPITGMDVIVVDERGACYLGCFHGSHQDWRNVDDTSQILAVTHFCIPEAIPLDDEE